MLEAGLQIRQRSSKDETGLFTYDTDKNEFINLPEYGNEIEYTNNIYAFYSMYRGYIKKFGYQLGLRGEYTYRNVNSITNNKNFIIDQIDYFPTFHFKSLRFSIKSFKNNTITRKKKKSNKGQHTCPRDRTMGTSKECWT